MWPSKKDRGLIYSTYMRSVRTNELVQYSAYKPRQVLRLVLQVNFNTNQYESQEQVISQRT
jgi:hypothetical protein